MSFFKSNDQQIEEVKAFVDSLLMPGEEIEKLFRLGIEFVAITNKRLILKDTDSVISRKSSVTTIPLSKVSAVSYDPPVSKLAPGMPTLKIFASGVSVDLNGFNHEFVKEAYNSICAKIL